MPLPLNQSTKRLSIGFPAPAGVSAAYAVPRELNIETSGGSPTIIGAPEAVRPFKIDRRESLTRFVMSCDMNGPFRVWKFPQTHCSHYKLFEMKLRALEFFQQLTNQRTVGRHFHAAGRIPEILLDHALLALRTFGEHRSQLRGRGELRIGDAGHISRGI